MSSLKKKIRPHTLSSFHSVKTLKLVGKLFSNNYKSFHLIIFYVINNFIMMKPERWKDLINIIHMYCTMFTKSNKSI